MGETEKAQPRARKKKENKKEDETGKSVL